MLFLFCCVGGVSGTPPPLLDLHSTEPIAMELHRSRDEHDIKPAGDFLAVLAHHEVWNLYVDWTRMCQFFFLKFKIWSRKCAVFRSALCYGLCASWFSSIASCSKNGS